MRSPNYSSPCRAGELGPRVFRFGVPLPSRCRAKRLRHSRKCALPLSFHLHVHSCRTIWSCITMWGCLSIVHIGADIVVTARRHWWQTRNTTWLREVGQPIAAAVADYYCSRTTPSASLPAFLNMGGTSGAVGADQLSIAGVLGPDEHDDNVTDSTCTHPSMATAVEFLRHSSQQPHADVSAISEQLREMRCVVQTQTLLQLRLSNLRLRVLRF